MAAPYDTATGWGTATVLDSSGLGIDPDVTLDDSGNACAIWNRYDALNYKNTVMVARYTSNGWDSPQMLQPEASTPVQPISGNNSGMTAVIWNQVTPITGLFMHKYNTYVSLFEPGAGWKDPQPVGNDIYEMNNIGYINPESTPGHYNPRISVDKQGNALALWSEVYSEGDKYHTAFNRYDTEKGWGTPQLLDNIGIPSGKIVFDDSGSAFISWTYNVEQLNNRYLSTTSFAKYDKANGWITENVLNKYPYYCFNSSIIAGKNGSLHLIWMQYSGNDSQLWMNKYSPVSGWSSGERLDSKTGNVDEYIITLDVEGQAIIIWTQYSGVHRNIWAKLIR